MIDFTVYGKPEPAGSKKAFVVKGRALVVDANKKSKPWQALVQAAALEAMALREDPILLEGPLQAEFYFGVEKPKSVKRDLPSVRPDLTKLIRGVEDACTGIVWRDDAQIVRQLASKFYAEGPPFVRVVVTQVDE